MVPLWYPLMQAAKYLGVSVWELEDAPSYWKFRALAAMNAEAHAQEMKSKK